nr:S-layer homology domain-containing protein [Lysinibacillus timonensis]
MTHQAKKYQKFVATAATATLVASAIMPVVAAKTPSDITTNDHAAAIIELLELGYVSGKGDGTFAPNEAITRGQVVLALGKWAESQGLEVPSDYLEKDYFKDYPSWLTEDNKKYYALVKYHGIFEGYSDGTLKPNLTLSRVQLAIVLNSAYKAVHGQSLVELAGDTSREVVSDLHAVFTDYRPAVLAMKKLGITSVTNFNPSGTVTRGQFASFLNSTIKLDAPAINTASKAKSIQSVQATGASKISVEFDGTASADTVQFSIARGTTDVKIKNVQWNEEKTVAVLTIDSKFNDATYTVSATGVSEGPITATVTTLRELVTAIEFLSDKLVFTGQEKKGTGASASTNYKEAVITFAVYNQYGEDMTDDVIQSYFTEKDVKGIDILDDPTNDIEIEKGKFVVWVDEDEDDDTTGTVELSYEHGDIELDVTQDVQLSDVSEPALVEVVGVYNANGKELSTENLKDNEEFSILFNVTDQYGNKLDAEFADKRKTTSGDTTILKEVRDGVRVSVSNDHMFELEDEDDTGTGHGQDGIKVMNVEGKHYFAIDIVVDDKDDLVGGENTVTFRSKATGEENSEVITVVDSLEPYEIEIGLPEDVIAGDEEVLLPVQVYDQHGELLTNVKDLNSDLRNDKIKIDWDENLTPYPSNTAQEMVFTFIEKNGQVYLKFKTKANTSDDAEDYDLEIEVEKSGIEHSINLAVEPNAYPERIVNLKDKGTAYVYLGETVELDPSDFLIQDQYGRAYVKPSKGSAGAPKYYSVSIESSSNDDIFDFRNSGETLEVVSKEKGTATIIFKFISYDLEGNKIEETIEETFRSFEVKDFDSFKVKSDEILFGGEDYTKIDEAAIKVVGLIGKQEVTLAEGDYYVSTISDYLNTDGTEVTADSAKIEADDLLENETSRYETDIQVVINDTGETIHHKISLAREKAVAKSLRLNDKSVYGKKALEDIIVEYTEVSSDHQLTANEIFRELLEEGKFDSKDQYGNKIVPSSIGAVSYIDGRTDNVRLIVTGIDSENDNGIISSNGSEDLSLKLGENGLSVGESFTLTLSLDDKSQTVKVYLR